MALGRYLRETYLTFDSRSLAAFRISLACALLLDLCFRAQAVEHFYTNQGLIPNHTMLWAPPTRRMFSYFFMASTYAEALFAMALSGVVFFLLAVGYRTRLMQFLALLCVVSLNTRIAVLENGGDIVLNHLCVWSVFLPLGERFSIDALRKSMRRRKESSEAELADRAPLRSAKTRVVSLAVLALLLQFAVIYFFNAVHKNGPTWDDGSAVHYALHQDRIANDFAVWMRENVPVPVLRFLTWATIGIEALGAALIISPLWPHHTRLLAVLIMPALHLAFALCMDLGIFSYAMAAYFPILLAPRHWEGIHRFLRARHRPRVVYYDGDCGICMWCARLLARLDVFDRLSLRDNRGELPSGAGPQLADRTLLVHDPATGRLHTRADAVAQLCRSLPFGFLAWPWLSLPGLSRVFGWLYDRVAQNRTAISAFFGLGVCGLPGAEPAGDSEESAPSDFALARARVFRILRELAIAALFVAAVGEVLRVNAAVPRVLRKYSQPEPLQVVIDYARLIQSWRMFAPQSPVEDEMISVEARTADGRLVDPYNEVASRVFTPPFDRIPPQLNSDQFFTTYSLYVPQNGFRALRPAFEQWILRYHERTGNPKDRIVSFKVYRLIDRSPPPGKTQPTHVRKLEFMRYPQR